MEAAREGAESTAAEGARLAADAGFAAEPLTVTGSPTWRRIIDVAEERGAGLVVIGSQGRTGLSRAVLGSVAAAVAQHSDGSVLIVHRR
jgi:nucleotide-binding universal stress UspA family protein